MQKEKCLVCNRHVHCHDMTIHHYVPECQGGTLQDTLRLCITCHSFLHYSIPLEEVNQFDTHDKIKNCEQFKNYIKLIENIIHPNIIKIKKLVKLLS